MATRKITKSRTALVETPATQASPPTAPRQAEEVTKISTAPLVLVNVPHGFTLTLDDGSPVTIRHGVQNLPEHLANHWYSKRCGVKPHSFDDRGSD